MMHLKTLKTSIFRITAAIIIVISLTAAFIKSLPVNEIVQVFAEGTDRVSTQEDIYKLIINKTITAISVSTSTNPDGEIVNLFSGIIFKFVPIDFRNPKTYLASEIPLLGLFDITILNGNVGGMSADNSTAPMPDKTKERENVEQEKIGQVEALSRNFPEQKLENIKVDSEKPEVIIYHTHTTESFLPTSANNYEMMGDHRTTNRNFNVTRLGEEIKNYLEGYYGLGVYHDMTLHDYPVYEGSYERSKPTAEKILKKYSDAKFIIDLHRDAFPDDDAARKSMVAQIRGDQVAKIMFVIGKSNPHWQENYYLALRLNQKLEELYPGVSKGILVADRAIYNQDVSNKSMIIEIGAECNTLEEVLISAKMVARAIGHIAKGN